MTIPVLIADSHPVVRIGLKAMLAQTSDLRVCAEATDGNGLLQRIRERDFGLVVLDLALPGRAELDLIRLAKSERPRLAMLVFTDYPEAQYAVRAIRAGACGYLGKQAEADAALGAMRRVAAGRVYVSHQVAELLVTDVSRDEGCAPHTLLTDREFSIFNRIVRGDKLIDIADELSISIKTVSTHKSNILDKMTLGGQVDLVHYAIAHKLLDAHE
jgi:two-component system, NarL family, invasion response regulator UvrY